MLLILGAKFGVPRNVSLKLCVHAAVAGEAKRKRCSARAGKLAAEADGEVGRGTVCE